MFVVVMVFGGLCLLTMVFCACLGAVAAGTDRVNDDALRSLGIHVPSQAELLAAQVATDAAPARGLVVATNGLQRVA